MARNKIIYYGETLIDLTGDTVTEATLLKGQTAHDKSGEIITGSCTYDSDTSDATVAVAEMLNGKTAYARGAQLTGTMPNNGAVHGVISDKTQKCPIAMGFHDGSGTVGIAEDEQAKIVAANIKAGVEILGVTGAYGGESVSAQSKTATPAATQQTIIPDEGYDYLSQVIVAAIPYVESDNAAGGKTVTIG